MKNTLMLFLVGLNLSLAKQDITENYSINVTAESKNDYILIGTDENGIVNGKDPELMFKIGSKIDFIVNSPLHPFLLKLKTGIGNKNQIVGVENNGASEGIIKWVPLEAGTYYYQCSKHKNMVGKIKIIE
jgi:plastocyanin